MLTSLAKPILSGLDNAFSIPLQFPHNKPCPWDILSPNQYPLAPACSGFSKAALQVSIPDAVTCIAAFITFSHHIYLHCLHYLCLWPDIKVRGHQIPHAWQHQREQDILPLQVSGSHPVDEVTGMKEWVYFSGSFSKLSFLYCASKLLFPLSFSMRDKHCISFGSLFAIALIAHF